MNPVQPQKNNSKKTSAAQGAMNTLRASKFEITLLALVVSASIAVITGVAYYTFVRSQAKKSTASIPTSIVPTPSPTPLITPKPIPKGEQVYRFSHGKDVTGPKPVQITVTPIDPRVDQEQSVLIIVSHPSPITQTSLTLVTDNQTQEFPLSFVKSDGEATFWESKWKMNDTYNRKYQINFTLSDDESQFEGGLTIR